MHPRAKTALPFISYLLKFKSMSCKNQNRVRMEAQEAHQVASHICRLVEIIIFHPIFCIAHLLVNP
jgi:hypothetical protein